MTSKLFRSAILASSVLTMLSGSAGAEVMKFTAQLKASSETPPTDSQGSGLLVGTFDPSTKKLTWDAHFAGLTGPATMAHFHAPAPVGKPAGVMVPIAPPVTSPIRGEATLTEEQAKNITDGMTYFNVHTAKYPKGEIRGQVELGK